MRRENGILLRAAVCFTEDSAIVFRHSFQRNLEMVCRVWFQVVWAVVVCLATLPECGAAEQIDSARPVTPAAKELRVGALRVDRVLFLGNSITLHGPAPKIGWTGNWGMAASAVEKDYVHLLTAQIAKTAGGMPAVKVKNIADFERNLDAYNLAEGLKDELEFQADLVIVAIGENSAALTTDEAKLRFSTSFAKLFAELKRHGNPTLIVRSQFWADSAKDERMKQACLDVGGVFVEISQLGADETNFARSERKFEHAGVAGHPGDKGMQALADELWKAIQKQATPASVKQD